MVHTALHTIHRLIRLGFTVLVLGMLPIAVFVLLTSNTDRIGGIRSFVVLTGSMTPTIPQGSITITKKAHAYGEGDVITFDRSGQNVTHRIVGQERINGDSFFVTQGDANAVTDSQMVTPEQIVGKTLFQLPYVGNVILHMKTLPGFLTFIILPGFVFIGFELWSIKNEIVRKTREEIAVVTEAVTEESEVVRV